MLDLMVLNETTKDMLWFFAAIAFVFGAVWGSFLNVCIYRLPAGKSIVWPGSHCGACGTPIQWFDNIPILSYLLLRGTCRACGTHFSARYAAIESLAGLLFAAVWLKYPGQFVVLAHWIVLCLLLIGTFTDIDHFIIPDSVTLGGLVFALTAALLLPPAESFCGQDFLFISELFGLGSGRLNHWLIGRGFVFVWSAICAAFGWLLLWSVGIFGRILFRKEAMGGGDIKLFAFLGAYFGLCGTIAILFLSSVLGAIGGSLLLLIHKVFRRDEFEELCLEKAKALRPCMVYQNRAFCGAEEAGEQMSDLDAADFSARVIRIPRKTSRQLHHFPFGPYIALAAAVLLFAFPEFKSLLQQYVWTWPDLAGK